MRLAKYGHSCILAEFPSGGRVLVDPGNMSSIPAEILAERIDAVLVTHSHADHIDGDLLAKIREAHPDVPVYGSADIATQFSGVTDHGYRDFAVGAVPVEVLQAGHEPVLGPVPENAAFRIGGELLVTGDSLTVSLDEWAGTRVLALVTSAPWGTRPGLAHLVERIKPEVAFPVHDGFLVDGFRANQDKQFEAYCEERGVRYAVLGAELAEV